MHYAFNATFTVLRNHKKKFLENASGRWILETTIVSEATTVKKWNSFLFNITYEVAP